VVFERGKLMLQLRSARFGYECVVSDCSAKYVLILAFVLQLHEVLVVAHVNDEIFQADLL
jgi:hypothetical protein